MTFEFATATHIVFGPGKLSEAGALCKKLGTRALVVTGGSPARAEALLNSLHAAGVTTQLLSAPREPSIASAHAGAQLARESGSTVVISMGGGSVIDTGKAIAALATNTADPLTYLEVIGAGAPLTAAPLPFIAIPTTAGSGAEVTRNAVLSSPEHSVKVSLRSPLMLPRIALVDPELTHSLAPSVTAATGMDALTQLIEPYVCARATPITDALSLAGIRLAAVNLPRAYIDGVDARARSAMATASLFGGMALANSGLGAVHGFAAPIGGMFDAPHGAVCARLLPVVWKANVAALRARDPKGFTLARYDTVATALIGNDDAWIDEATEWLYALREALEIPPLRSYGLGEADIAPLVEKAAVASSMQANPIKLTADELGMILSEAL